MSTKVIPPKPLTVEILKSLKWIMNMHMNGGSKFSILSYHNAEYKLLHSKRTNGSPKYEIEVSEIATDDGEIVCNLLAEDKAAEIERFVKAYNDRILKVFTGET